MTTKNLFRLLQKSRDEIHGPFVGPHYTREKSPKHPGAESQSDGVFVDTQATQIPNKSSL
jgi:hypothetical protein